MPHPLHESSPPLHRPRRRWRGAAALCLGLGACLGETELLTLPPPPPTTLTLVVRADPEDAASAAALGWADGIPDAEVTLTPEDPPGGAPLTLRSSATGTVVLEGIPSGGYRGAATRWLAEEERARLPAGDDAVGFVTRFLLTTSAGVSPVEIRLPASRRRSLVISEWKGDPVFVLGEGQYNFTGYVRLYNNADTTVYLDGLLVGEALSSQHDAPNFGCTVYQPWTLDPTALWSRWFHQLPGRGTEYPLAPGESVVLATDAIDHSVLFSRGLDLRQADFEFFSGPGDVDNPSVPNAADVGPQTSSHGHGVYWNGTGIVAWVARPIDPATLERQAVPPDRTYARIPREQLLDVMTTRSTYTSPWPDCAVVIHPNIDRGPAKLLGGDPNDDFRAARRALTPVTLNGRMVLQDTRWSALDFGIAPREPFARP